MGRRLTHNFGFLAPPWLPQTVHCAHTEEGAQFPSILADVQVPDATSSVVTLGVGGAMAPKYSCLLDYQGPTLGQTRSGEKDLQKDITVKREVWS